MIAFQTCDYCGTAIVGCDCAEHERAVTGRRIPWVLILASLAMWALILAGTLSLIDVVSDAVWVAWRTQP